MQQNAQTLNVNVNNSVLHKAKPEILRGVELLIEKMQNEMADLLVEVRLILIVFFCVSILSFSFSVNGYYIALCGSKSVKNERFTGSFSCCMQV